MTKINYDCDGLKARVINKLDDAYETLNTINNLKNQTRVPSGFNGSRYNDSMKKLINIQKDLRNINQDLIKANKNYEEMEADLHINNSKINYEYKITADEPLILAE